MPPGGKVRSGVVTLSRIAGVLLCARGNVGHFSPPFKIKKIFTRALFIRTIVQLMRTLANVAAGWAATTAATSDQKSPGPLRTLRVDLNPPQSGTGPNSGPWILRYRKIMYHRGVIFGGRRKSLVINFAEARNWVWDG